MRFLNNSILILACILQCNSLLAQKETIPDSIQNYNSNFHFQLTTVTQFKAGMHAPYTGLNSLIGTREAATTLTSTIFWGVKLWNYAAFYINPEITGGAGLSTTHGIAGFTNGEAYRVGNPTPLIYPARVFFQQIINFGNGTEQDKLNPNSVYKTHASRHFDITVGKFGIADYFDNNTYSHNPRKQFLNWSLMSNGAWDYPANVRGYTWGIILAYGTQSYSVRATSVMVPTEANGNIMDKKIGKAYSCAIEFEKIIKLNGRSGAIRFLGFYTQAHMGNYKLAIQENPTAPDITTTRKYSRTKHGFGINLEQEIIKGVGVFARISWNDGHNETWAFTEIDRSLSGGISFTGNKWIRKKDVLGIGSALNGISSDHRNYLAAGGYGFIIGDGKLNYGHEWIIEIYYRADLLSQTFYITPNFQYVRNPAYNKDRGPAFIGAIRAHIQF